MTGQPRRRPPANRGNGTEARPVLPSSADMPILRRAARGYIIATFVDGEPHYTYEDGEPVTLRENRGDSGKGHFTRLVTAGWLIADRGDTLFAGVTGSACPAQIYRARKP